MQLLCQQNFPWWLAILDKQEYNVCGNLYLYFEEGILVKKFLALSTALVLALSLLCVGALADPNPADIVGTWKLSALEMMGASFDPAAFGMEVAMVLNEDNTAVMKMEGEEDATATWAIVDGLVVITPDDEDLDEEEVMGLTFEDGVLFAEIEDEEVGTMRMVFSKVEE